MYVCLCLCCVGIGDLKPQTTGVNWGYSQIQTTLPPPIQSGLEKFNAPYAAHLLIKLNAAVTLELL
jgi:hypothetical protein